MNQNENVAGDDKSESQTTDGDTGAQSDDLDKLLDSINQEFDDGVKKVETPTADQKLSVLENQLNSLLVEQAKSGVDTAVADIQHELQQLDGPKLADRVVRAMLNEMASEDPRIANAFQNRGADPASWKKIEKFVAQNMADEFSPQIDTQLTEDRRALTAAIRGKTVQTDDDSARLERFMNTAKDHEFNEWKRSGRIPDSFKG